MATKTAKPAAAKPRGASGPRPQPRAKVAKAADEAPAVDAPAKPRADVLRLKDLVERVSARSEAKKKDVRAVAEAVLSVLGDALHDGQSLALPGLGKARVSRQKATGGGEMLVVRLRRAKAGEDADGALAEVAE